MSIIIVYRGLCCKSVYSHLILNTKVEDYTEIAITSITDNITLTTDLCRSFRKSCNWGYNICNSSTRYFQAYAYLCIKIQKCLIQ